MTNPDYSVRHLSLLLQYNADDETIRHIMKAETELDRTECTPGNVAVSTPMLNWVISQLKAKAANQSNSISDLSADEATDSSKVAEAPKTAKQPKLASRKRNRTLSLDLDINRPSKIAKLG